MGVDGIGGPNGPSPPSRRSNGGLTTRNSTIVGWPQIELTLLSFNRLGAMLTVALGATAMLAAHQRSVPLLWGAAGGFAAMAVQVVIQWGGDANLFGGTGRNLALWMGLAIGLGALAWALEAGEPDESESAGA